MTAPRIRFQAGGFLATNSSGSSLMSMRSRIPTYSRSGSSGVGNVPATPVSASACSTRALILRRASESTCITPSLPPFAPTLALAGDLRHVVECAVLLVDVELLERAQARDDVVPPRAVPARLPLAGQLHQLAVLESVYPCVVPQHVCRRFLDRPALDLGGVRVRNPCQFLYLPQRQPQLSPLVRQQVA